jgi:hypothetical protein
MANLFQTLEAAAARGAEGLTSDARGSVAAALRALQQADGGFAGLDGRSDAYYSFFAWLSLRALGARFERERLCAFLTAQRPAAKRIDAQCAELVLAVEGRGMRASWLSRAAAVLRRDTREVYAAFLLLLATGDVPRWVARLAWRRQRFGAGAARRLPTPRLAAGLMLATLAGEESDTGLLAALLERRSASGGFASAAGAEPDLLATAVARFAIGVGRSWKLETGNSVRPDLAFIEACWLDDGLFGASPNALRGDAEHTFYGLLALGTCR